MFHGALERLTFTVTQWPGVTLWAVALLTLLSIGITARFLTFKTNRADLLDPKTEYHRRWLQFVEQFGDDADVVVVVEGENPEAIIPVLDRLSEKLAAEPDHFSRVLCRIDPGNLRRKALQYLRPKDLEAANRRLEMYSPILQGHWNRAGLESYCLRMADFLRRQSPNSAGTEDGVITQAHRLSLSLERYFENPREFDSPWPEIVSPTAFPKAGAFDAQYQLSPGGRMGFLLVLPRDTGKTFSGASASLTRLHKILAEVQSESPNATLRMTGIPILEADEMARSQEDMALASALSFAGVGLILLIGFRGLRHPLLAMIMLAVGIAWSLGYTTLAVGHLNILSVSFAAILIGLGIDFAIHYLARYLELRHQGKSLREALISAARSTGSGIITAAVTTSLAFLCATFTNFLGIAELGIIAGGGILLCTLVTFLVLPSLIMFADRRREPRQLPTPFQANLLRQATSDHPWLVACASLVCVAAVAAQGFTLEDGRLRSKVGYDYNLLNLQAKGLPSVELQNRIFEESNGSLLYAVSIADSPQQARLLKKRFLELPTVTRVEELGSYMPEYPASETNLLVQAIHARLSHITEFPREFPQIDPLSIGRSIEMLLQALKERDDSFSREAAQALDGFLDRFEHLPLEQQMHLLGGFQQAMLMSLHRQFQGLASISDPIPVSPEDFPEAIRSRFVSQRGSWLLRVYPTRQIWDEQPLTEFVQDVRSVDPEATGTPLQNYEAARQIQESYLNAAVFALATIILVLLIDSLSLGPLLVTLISPTFAVGYAVLTLQRSGQLLEPIPLIALYIGVAILAAAVFDLTSIRNMLLTMLPPIGGLLMMVGALGVMGMHFNPANLIVLPLLMGIGVDDGVHVVHDFRMQKGKYRTAPSTINAITLTSLTSMAGFGSMLIAAHQGLVSLAVVLVVGVGSCLFISLVFLPAVLTLISNWRRDDSDHESSMTDEGDEAATILAWTDRQAA